MSEDRSYGAIHLHLASLLFPVYFEFRDTQMGGAEKELAL